MSARFWPVMPVVLLLGASAWAHEDEVDGGVEAASEPVLSTVVSAHASTTSASSNTIRNTDFEMRAKSTPNDILRVVPGLLAVQHQGGGKADQLFLRGFDADHGTDVGIFIDGVPVNMPSHAHGQGYADLNWLIPEALEKIEVTKGPYDPRYGDFATAGSVNLVTREAFEGNSVAYTLNMSPTVPGRLASGARLVGIASPELPDSLSSLHPWLAFETAWDDGPFNTKEDLNRYNLFGKLTYDLTPNIKTGVFFQAYGSGWKGSGQLPARLVDSGQLSRFGSLDPSEGGQTERQMATAFLKYHGQDQELDVSLYVTRYQLALWNDFTFFLNDPRYGDEIEQDDKRVFTGGRVAYHFHRTFHGVRFRTTLGAEMRFDGIHVDRWDAESQLGDFRRRLQRHVDTSDSALSANDDDINQLDVAGYAEEDVIFNDYVRLIGGIRGDFIGFDVNDRTDATASGTRQFTTPSPKLSAIVAPLPGTLELFANFGEGFHTNQAPVALIDGVKHVNADGSSYTVHALPHLYGGEVGARVHLFDRIDLSAALWGSYLENETVFDADNASFAPSAPTRRIGVDFGARAKIFPWLTADFDLAQADATAVADHGNGGAVALAPRLYMTGGLTAKHRSGLRGGLRFRYLGPRPAFDESSAEYKEFASKTLPNGAPNPEYDPARVTAQGYFVVDAYAAYRWRFLEASLSVENLFNTQWREAQFGNRSCSYDETFNPMNPGYSGAGKCGVTYGADRQGVADVHFTPGVPLTMRATLKAYF